jgi:hypothetical protein
MFKFELMSRRLFLWQKDVDEQKEKVADMRRKNEALVYNILPPHVAIHFLGKRKNDEVIKAYISANKTIFYQLLHRNYTVRAMKQLEFYSQRCLISLIFILKNLLIIKV